MVKTVPIIIILLVLVGIGYFIWSSQVPLAGADLVNQQTREYCNTNNGRYIPPDLVTWEGKEVLLGACILENVNKRFCAVSQETYPKFGGFYHKAIPANDFTPICKTYQALGTCASAGGETGIPDTGNTIILQCTTADSCTTQEIRGDVCVNYVN